MVSDGVAQVGRSAKCDKNRETADLPSKIDILARDALVRRIVRAVRVRGKPRRHPPLARHLISLDRGGYRTLHAKRSELRRLLATRMWSGISL